jgi:Acetyltransferase (GNAT) domain
MAKPETTTTSLPDVAYSEWNDFVAASPTGSVYSRCEYLDALCTAGGGRFQVRVVRQGQTLLGGIALYERNGRHGTFVSPRLLLYYNGPVLRRHETKYPSEQTARDLKTLGALANDLATGNYGSVVLKPRPPVVDVRPFLAAGWTARQGYTYVVPIVDLDQTRARIEQNLRRLIDRCARADVQFTHDDDFDSFFRLHALTMDRVDASLYLPRPAFARYYELLARQGLAQLFHARLPNGQAVASQLVLLGHPVTHTVSAGVDPEHAKSGVTAFLRWKVFEHLSAAGYAANDLTDASLNSVTHFKSQLGGTLEPWLELRSPESRRFRWGARSDALVRGMRAAAGGVARRAIGRIRRRATND